MLVAISVLRSCGVLDLITQGIGSFFHFLGVNTDLFPHYPPALMRPLSGAAGRGMMISTMTQYGPDSFVVNSPAFSRVRQIPLFTIAALYFGSIGINKIRYAIPAALIADLAAIVTAHSRFVYFLPALINCQLLIIHGVWNRLINNWSNTFKPLTIDN